MKKVYITLLTVLAILVISFSYCYAENSEMVDGIRNMVGGAENSIENAGQGLMNGTKDAINNGKNMIENTADNIGNGIQNIGNEMQDDDNTDISGMTTDTNNNNDYTAVRTANDGNSNGTFLGMNPTIWTWVIIGVIGAAIVALVWIYGKQHEENYND